MSERTLLHETRMEDTVTYCCDDKKRLMNNHLFADRLNVTPNVITFSKHEKCRTYKKTVEIRNEDINSAYVTLTSDFPNELSFRTTEDQLIEPQLSKTVEIYYEPTENFQRNELGNRRYSVFICLRHPKLTIEIPVILFRTNLELLIPKRIFFPKCAINVTSYYAMVVYNPLKKLLLFIAKWIANESNIQLLIDENTFAASSCTRFLFSLTPNNYCNIFDELNILCAGENFCISFLNEVEAYEPHISNKYVQFSRVYVGFSANEHFYVCNESCKPIKIKWCRKERKECEVSECVEIEEPKNVKKIDEHFMITPKSATILPNSSILMRATFIPKPYVSDVKTNDLKFETYAYLAFNTNEHIRLRVSLSGTAKGPSIVLNFCFLELGSIVIGEKRCVRIKASNTSQIPGIIKFVGSDSKFGGVASCAPLFHTLEPEEEKQFVVEYYPTVLGKFMEKILFQVENGRELHMMISGVSEPIRLIPIPSSIDFGTVFTCSLQKKELIIRNPLSSSVLVTLSTENDGGQEPLIISNFQNFVDGLEFDEEDDETGSLATEQDRILESNPLLESSNSSDFVEFVDNTDDIAKKFVKIDRVHQITTAPHPDLSILQNVIGDLLKSDYFQPLAEMVESQKKKIKLPATPMEYLFSPEPIIIEAFQSATVPIFVVPNRSDRRSVNLQMQATIIDSYGTGSATFEKNTGFISLPRDATITTMPLSRTCLVPELEIACEIHAETGIDLPERLEFPIKNLVNVPGIILVNFGKTSSVDVSYSPKAFAIKPFESVECDLVVTSRFVGDTTLDGWIEIFGSQKLHPFKINCHTMPPKLKIHVTPIKYTGKVLMHDVCMTYIENLGNGLLQYSMSLKNSCSMKCNTTNDSAKPKECKEVSLSTYFEDPGSYKNVLYLDVKHLHIIEVPVQATVHGLPLKFEPNVDPVLNLELVATSVKPLKTPVSIQNFGRNSYKVYISKKKHKLEEEDKPKFVFPVNIFQLAPQEIFETELSLSRKNLMFLKEEFNVDAVEMTSHKRYPGFTFTVEANIIASKLIWSRPKLEFEYRNSDFFDTSFGESVSLINKSLLTENATLESIGSFKIFDSIHQIFCSKLNFVMEPNEMREFIVCFDVKEINRWNQDIVYEGKILLTTPEKNHKALGLFCKIFYPIVTLPMQEVQYNSLTPFSTSFCIDNPGELLAFYQWSYEGAPSKEKVHVVKHTNFQTVWDHLAAVEPLKLFSIDINKEWMMSFKRFIEWNLEDDEVNDEISELNSSMMKLESVEEPPKEEASARSNKKSRKKSAKQNEPEKSESVKSKRENKAEKSEKSSTRSVKSGKISKTIEELPPVEQIEEQPMPPEFICNESKLQVGIDGIVDKLYEVFHIEDNNECDNSTLQPGNISTLAKEFNMGIEPTPAPELYVTLDHYRGSIQSKTQKKINMYFAGDPEDVTIESTLILDVAGGKSEKLTIKICNAPVEVEISKSNFEIGIQPWHKISYFQINIRNTNSSPVQIVPALNEYRHKDKRLLSGYIDVLPKQSFSLPPDISEKFLVTAFVGLNQNFHEAFGIEVNCGMPASIEFKGRALIPMISILHAERLPSENVSIEQEYVLLNRIYKDQIAGICTKGVNVTDSEIEEFKEAMGMFDPEEMEVNREKPAMVEESDSSVTASSISNSYGAHLRVPPSLDQKQNEVCSSTNAIQIEQPNSNLTYRKDRYDFENSQLSNTKYLIITQMNKIEIVSNFKKPKFRAEVMQIADPDLANFCVLDYPDEYPSSLELHHLIEIECFQREIAKNSLAWKNYVKIVKKYVLKNMNIEKSGFKEEKFIPPIRPTSFKIQPLPYYASSYRLNFGTLLMDKRKNWTLELYFHGPGKVFFTVRTLVVIPGMKITILEPDFECDGANGGYKFSIYNNTLVPKANCKYRNIKARSCEDIRSVQQDCGECKEDKICRAHSFDFNAELIHTREIGGIDRKTINEFYSWWNRSDKEVKDPYIHCEIFQERLARTDGKIFKINIEFNPTSRCYDDPTSFEDCIYIDIHLGPTIPILLEGTICSTENESSGSVVAESA